MQRPSIAQSVYKLALAGEQAGFSVKSMIQLLNAGFTVETLLNLIEWQLTFTTEPPQTAPFSRWIM